MFKQLTLGACFVLAMVASTVRLSALDVSVYAYFSPSSPGYPILAFGSAQASSYAWVWLEMTLWRGSAQSWTYDEGFSYVNTSDSAVFEAGQNYYLEALACADWGSYYDCDFSTDYYQAPGAPIILSIDPGSVARDQCHTLQIYGENLDLATVQISSVYAYISDADVYYNQITCTLCVGQPEEFLIWAQTAAGASNTKIVYVN